MRGGIASRRGERRQPRRRERISELVAAAVNIAGIACILDLKADNPALLAANRAMVKAAKKATSKTGTG